MLVLISNHYSSDNEYWKLNKISDYGYNYSNNDETDYINNYETDYINNSGTKYIKTNKSSNNKYNSKYVYTSGDNKSSNNTYTSINQSNSNIHRKKNINKKTISYGSRTPKNIVGAFTRPKSI